MAITHRELLRARLNIVLCVCVNLPRGVCRSEIRTNYERFIKNYRVLCVCIVGVSFDRATAAKFISGDFESVHERFLYTCACFAASGVDVIVW